MNWTDEQPCLEGIASETALFYAIEPQNEDESDSENEDLDQDTLKSLSKGEKSKWKLEYDQRVRSLISESFRYMLVPNDSVRAGHIVQLADLHDLYKVFERC